MLLQGSEDLQMTLQQQTSELAVLREQSSNFAKERAALKTILDAKIKALVDDIGHSVAETSQEVLHMACTECHIVYHLIQRVSSG